MINNLFVSFLIVLNSFGILHSDRISRPERFIFQFIGHPDVRLKYGDTDSIRKWSLAIPGLKNLKKVEVLFSTGERAIFIGNGLTWSGISIHHGKKSLSVPKPIVDKISHIHFNELELLWKGDKRTSFTSEYLSLVFPTGTQKYFGKYPEIHLLCYRLSKWEPEIFVSVSLTSSKYSPF